MMITKDELSQAFPSAKLSGRLDEWFEPLTAAMEKHSINNAARIASFLANVGEETGELQEMEENLHYTAPRLMQVWPSLFGGNEEKARELAAAGPEAIANYVYDDANRPHTAALGNTHPGDGWKYRGRGPMNTTGRDNYARYFSQAGLPPDSDPDLLLHPEHGAGSAAYIWELDGCNTLADMGRFYATVLKMNGGATNLQSRLNYRSRILNAMGEPATFLAVRG